MEEGTIDFYHQFIGHVESVYVGISTFISMINTTSASLKAIKVLFFSFHHFSFYEQFKFYNLVLDSPIIKN